MGRSKLYGIGVLLTFLGGNGLVEINMGNHGCFVICTLMFSVGFAICLTDFIH